jgi:hypothetical protein
VVAKSPLRSRSAPVKAPRTWPKSSLSSSVSGIAAQFTETSRPLRRSLALWIARATISLPVPLSPSIRIGTSVAATRSISSKSLSIAALRPTIPNRPLPTCDSSVRRVSARSRRVSSSSWVLSESSLPRSSARVSISCLARSSSLALRRLSWCRRALVSAIATWSPNAISSRWSSGVKRPLWKRLSM